jgi:hypothetical protein
MGGFPQRYYASTLGRFISPDWSPFPVAAFDLDSVLTQSAEEDAVISAPKAKFNQRRLEFLYVASARRDVAIDAMQNVERRLTINLPQLSLGLRRPSDCQTRLPGFSAQSPNSRKISS